MLRMTDYTSAIDQTLVERNAASYKEGSLRSSRFAKTALGWLLMAIGTSVILIAVVTFLSLTLPRVAGLNAYVIASGSMEPEYPINCVVYARSAEPSELSTGDVIIFSDPSRGTTPITHRVVTNDTASGLFTTKGDANAAVDLHPVSYDNVIGKVVMHLPYLGYVASVFTGFFGRLSAALVLIASWFVIEEGRRLANR